MAGVSGQARVWVWATAVLSGVAVVALVLVAIFADLDSADRLASVAGAAFAALGLVVAVVQLARSGSAAPPVTGARSVQAGGSIGRAVTGDHNRLYGSAPAVPATPVPTPPPAGPTPPGERGVSAAGNIGEAVTGDGNEQR
ncbi:hypothetical protein [Streptomyces sp. cmx-18-6]|uniref:hypothetical protein n=1 Tax=Streptomyces sp. cmx-18-6 TaxID=2790930 RepID=UPI00397F71BC